MGFAKRLLEEQRSRGYDSSNRTVCAKCFSDYAIRSFIKANLSEKVCSFCGRQSVRRNIAAQGDAVVQFILKGIRSEYSDVDEECVHWDSETGEYIVPNYDNYDLFTEQHPEVTEEDSVRDWLIDCIHDHQWCSPDPAVLSPSEGLVAGWNDFCEAVKYKTRFLFFDPNPHEPGAAGAEPFYVHPSELLDELASVVKTLKLITTLPVATVIYRARAHENGSPGYSTVAELGPPPKEVARAGRMNAEGIVVFYGAFDDQTAIAEINRPGDAMSIGVFSSLSALRVLDLTKLPPTPSIFDLKRKGLRTPLSFMGRFRDDISQAIKPDDRLHLEYTPTQIVTEYFRARFRDRVHHRIDGIVYPSARREDGRNVALFVSREQIEGIELERSYIKPDKKLTLDSITIISAPTSQQPLAGSISV